MDNLYPPLLNGDVERDIKAIHGYLYELAKEDADTGWSVSATTTDRSLSSGDTLLTTQNVLATLIQVLIEKGILSE